MTNNKEDYLKIIYAQGNDEEYVANKWIAEKMGVTPASVTEMLLKLQKEGLVEYLPYHGSKLTQRGYEVCIDIVRGHRLWEVFLMRHLGYTWREAHEDADLLEHIAPTRLVDRLDLFLNYPKTCPHGSPIPSKGQVLEKRIELLALNCLKEGDHAVISKIDEEGTLLDYLCRKGLKIGASIQLLTQDEYEGPVTFQQGEEMIVVSYKAASMIYVKQTMD